MGAEAFAEYRSAIHAPATVHAMLEDYRAGLGIDRRDEEADRTAGRRLTCPGGPAPAAAPTPRW